MERQISSAVVDDGIFFKGGDSTSMESSDKVLASREVLFDQQIYLLFLSRVRAKSDSLMV